MSLPDNPPPNNKQKKRGLLGLGDLLSSRDGSSSSNPKRPRLSAEPSLPTADAEPGSVPMQVDGHHSGGTTTTGHSSGKKRAVYSGWKSALGVCESSIGVLGPIKSLIDGLNECTGLFEKRSSTRRKDCDELLEKLQPLLEDLTEQTDISNGSMMTGSVKGLCSAIEDEIEIVKQKQAKNTGRFFKDAIDASDEILESYRRIDGLLNRLTLNANLTIIKALDEQNVDSRLAKLCPAMSATYNSTESDDMKRGDCAPGTRGPQVSFLLEWASDRNAGQTCWMNGMAGTGKTTIAYSVCSKLEEAHKLGASFFCTRVIPECRQVKNIIPSIAYQLARFSLPFRSVLLEVLDSDADAHTRKLKIQYQKLIVEPMRKVQESLPTDFIVVIDALDECENEGSLNEILELLISPVFALPVRYLISSRPEPEIYRRMMGRLEGQDDKCLMLHDLDSAIVKSDIEAYMKQELEDISLTEDQWSSIIERCGALFIYASTTCRYITEAYRMDTLDEAVETIVGLAPMSKEHEENGIDKLYITVLTAVFNKPGISRANKDRMKNILDTVICAVEPMTLEIIANLFELKSTKQVDALLQPLRSVLNVTRDTRLVTTLHASFPDFMLSQNRSKAFCCTQEIQHATLTKACLQTINRAQPGFNICRLPSSYLLDDEVENLNTQISRAISPGLVYACRYWSTHLYHGEYQVSLIELVRNFFSAKLLLWMEIVNLAKYMKRGTRIIQYAEKWCTSNKRAVPEDLTAIVHDAAQFVSVYANHPASQSTPHIYASMLPFWPSSRPISAAYVIRTSGLVKPTGTAIDRRRLALIA
ncbi:unnamed protein product, partial [Rhizoctonia solani]